jgi:ABC-type bacteriocin/lantibiotic exporter with double-glycine peptidase domain
MNAAKCFRKNLSENVVKKFTMTTKKDGTGDFGITTALREFGFEYDTIDTKLWDEALDFVMNSLCFGSPVIICSHNLQHWMVVGGMIGNDFIVFDSSNSKRNKKEHGVRIIEANRLKRIWKSNCNRLFGIRVKEAK